jgi:hypothetical protein
MKYKLVTEAGKKLIQLGNRFKNNIEPLTPGRAAGLFGPDLFFGAMAGMQTPGDLTDKVIAGTGSAVGGVIGGVGLSGLIAPRNPAMKYGLDFIGSIAGDNAGLAVADQVLKVKGGGVTPWERQQIAYEQQLERDIRQQIYREMSDQY